MQIQSSGSEVLHVEIDPGKKSGQERFIGINSSLMDYWSWAHSDIISNSERGKLSEYIVRCAVHSASTHRVEWDEIDLISEEGIRIEVKSSAYLQSWHQRNPSTIQFDIAPKRGWSPETNLYDDKVCRHADVYVFCLLACRDKVKANPLDMHQWEFYVLSTKILDKMVPKQKTIGLSSLLRLGAERVEFQEIHHAVKNAVGES